ncbi:MAG: hypothetical protein KDA32_03600 [Phycisphaerales bacterium]|nr:hypothetical protein [Phycisphaerales bacterium]
MDETGYHEPALSWVSRVAARDGSEVARVYVNPDTGCVTAVESDTHHATLTGRVLGRATVGLAAIEVSGTDLVPIPDIEVFVTGGVSPASGFTDRNGYYSINVDGAGPFSIATSSEDAQYRSVVNYVDGNNPRILAASKTWTSADPNLVLNDVNDPNVAQTAVVNALVHYHEARNFFESRWSLDVLGFNHQIRVNHVPSGCGLGNSGSPNLSPMLLYRELTGCRNGAMSTVIAHEFGHLVQASLGLSREQVFGESVGDTIAFLLYNTEVFASEVHPGQGADRTPLCPRRDYLYNPTLDAHLTSMILSGLWLDIRREIEVSGGESISCSVMDSSFDPNDPNCVSACVSRTASEGNEFVSQLFVDWTQLTLGPIREPGLVHSRPAHFGTAIEILTVLDDDGDLSNGGPHYAEIEAAFDLHQIPFPSIDPVRFFFPEGRPSVVRPNIPLDFQVVVVYPEANEPTDLSAALELGYCNSCNAVTDFNDLETGQVSLVDGNCPLTGLGFDPNELAAGLTHAAYCLSLPATDCGDGIAFGLRFALENDATFVSPTDAVHRLHRATPGWGRRTEVVWDMEQVSIGDPNWRVDPNEPNGLDFGPLASLGTWQIGVPDIYLDLSGALMQPSQDHTDNPGRLCWVTDRLGADPNNSAIIHDVTNGATYLVSPLISSEGANDAIITFWMWYQHVGADQGEQFRVQLRNASDPNWTTAIRLSKGDADAVGGWRLHQIRLVEFIDVSGPFRMRFVAQDITPGADSRIEALLDDLTVELFGCCEGDLTVDGIVGIADLAGLLAAFGRSYSDPLYTDNADQALNGVVDLADLALLLSRFGCECDAEPNDPAYCAPSGGGGGEGGGGGFFGPSSPAVTVSVAGYDTSNFSAGDFVGETDDFVFDVFVEIGDPNNDDWTSHGAIVETTNGATLRLAMFADPNDPNNPVLPEPNSTGEPDKYVCFVGVPKPVNSSGRFTNPGANYAGGYTGGVDPTYTSSAMDVAWFDNVTSNDGPAAVMRIVIDVSGVSGADTSGGFGSVYFSTSGPITGGDIEVATLQTECGVLSEGSNLTGLSGSFYVEH